MKYPESAFRSSIAFSATVLLVILLFTGQASAQDQYTSPKEACQSYAQISGLAKIITNTEGECMVRVGDENSGYGFTRYYYSGNKLCVENSGAYYNLSSPQTTCTTITQPPVKPLPAKAPAPNVSVTGAEKQTAKGDGGIIGDIDYSRGTVDLIRNGADFHVTPDFQASIGAGDGVRIGEGGVVELISDGGAVQFGENTFADFIGLKFDPPKIVGPDIPEGILDPNYKYQPDHWEFWTDLAKDLVDFNASNPPKFLYSCLAAELDPKDCGEETATFLHDGVGWFQDKLKEDFPPRVIVTPRTAIMANGTEFVVEVAHDGATTVTTLGGTVAVMDLISRKGIIVAANHAVTVPKSAQGLSVKELQLSLAPIDPSSMKKWWVKDTGRPSDQMLLAAFAGMLVIVGSTIALIRVYRRRKQKKGQGGGKAESKAGKKPSRVVYAATALIVVLYAVAVFATMFADSRIAWLPWDTAASVAADVGYYRAHPAEKVPEASSLSSTLPVSGFVEKPFIPALELINRDPRTKYLADMVVKYKIPIVAGDSAMMGTPGVGGEAGWYENHCPSASIGKVLMHPSYADPNAKLLDVAGLLVHELSHAHDYISNPVYYCTGKTMLSTELNARTNEFLFLYRYDRALFFSAHTSGMIDLRGNINDYCIYHKIMKQDYQGADDIGLSPAPGSNAELICSIVSVN